MRTSNLQPCRKESDITLEAGGQSMMHLHEYGCNPAVHIGPHLTDFSEHFVVLFITYSRQRQAPWHISPRPPQSPHHPAHDTKDLGQHPLHRRLISSRGRISRFITSSASVTSVVTIAGK
jgi:hypothetical protein